MKFKYRQQKPKILENLLAQVNLAKDKRIKLPQKPINPPVIKKCPHCHVFCNVDKDKQICTQCLGNLLSENNTKQEKQKPKKQKGNMVIEDGKYKFYIQDYILYCERYGDPWKNYIGDNAILFLFHRVLEQSKIIDNLRFLIKEKILKG